MKKNSLKAKRTDMIESIGHLDGLSCDELSALYKKYKEGNTSAKEGYGIIKTEICEEASVKGCCIRGDLDGCC